MDFNGTWKNQHGSLLELRVDGERVGGRFESGVGEGGKPHWVDVHGQVQEDLITFHASFPRHGTLVSWVGQHTSRDGVDQIQAQWLHATNVPDSRGESWMWYANRIGSDTFVRS